MYKIALFGIKAGLYRRNDLAAVSVERMRFIVLSTVKIGKEIERARSVLNRSFLG